MLITDQKSALYALSSVITWCLQNGHDNFAKKLAVTMHNEFHPTKHRATHINPDPIEVMHISLKVILYLAVLSIWL